MTAPERLSLLGYPLDDCALEDALGTIALWLETEQPEARTVITLNPEMLMQAQTDAGLSNAIRGASLSTADGVGIVWAAKRLLGRTLRGRATGVDLVQDTLQRFGPQLRVYLLGAKPGVAARAADICTERYGVQIVGTQDGYFKPEDEARIVESIRASHAHLLVTGLGAGRQERFNFEHRQSCGVRVAIGVGGTIDVLAGEVERAPAWTSKLGVEWVWRVTKLKRWDRAKRLVDFVLHVLKQPRS